MSLSVSICKSPKVSLRDPLSVPTVSTLSQPKGATLAVPYMYRRDSGRYYYRLRPTGSLCTTASVSLGTTERTIAMKRYNHLSATMKAFMLDNDNATFEELRAHLKSIAASFLNDKAESYWSGVEVDHLSDAKSDLREIAATQSLNNNQHRVIIEALNVLSMVSDRVNKGDAKALLDYVESTQPDSTGATSEASEALSVAPVVAPKAVTFESLFEDLMIEKRLTLKPASLRDLESTLRTVSKFITAEGGDLLSRPMWLSVRDAMIDSGLAHSTINKAMTKAKMLLDYALMNDRLTGRNPIERMKLTDAESKRKAFSEAQLVSLMEGLDNVANANQRYLVYLGLITGARIGELTQLTPEDIKCVEGHWCIDINEDNGKTVKNKASCRVVPLTDGAYGFNLKEFLEFTASRPKGSPLLGMQRDTASKWFNETYKIATVGHCENVTFHSLRHSMASTLKAAGVALTDAQGILGHSSQSITFDLYGRGHAIGRLAEALRVLPDAKGGTSGAVSNIVSKSVDN